MADNVLLRCGWTLFLNNTAEHDNVSTNKETYRNSPLSMLFDFYFLFCNPWCELFNPKENTNTLRSFSGRLSWQLCALSLLGFETFPILVPVLSLYQSHFLQSSVGVCGGRSLGAKNQ